MLILRIRQAESALADGRLDEAFELACDEEVRAHRHGQRLIGRLARSLVSRGREHLDADRLQQAMADCEKAGRLAGNLPEASELRSAVGRAISTKQRSQRRQADVLAAARQHVENGRLSSGEDLLADMDPASVRVKALRDEVVARRGTVAAALRRTEAAITNEDWAAAVDELSRARQAHAADEQVAELTARLTSVLNQRIRSAVELGRLDLAELLLRRLVSLANQNIETRELARVMSQCQLAGEFIEQGRPREACEALRKLTALCPSAAWVRGAMNHAQQAADGLETLRSGPLGLLSTSRPDTSRQGTTGGGAPKETVTMGAGFPEGTGGNNLPSRFVIQVDGVGAFLVLSGRRVTIGPAGSSRRPELALMTEQSTPTTTIERTDDDYFLSSSGPVRVNGKSTVRTLLSDGDKIALSRRCRLRFGLPHPASTSAVLDLSGTRLPTGDARRVILLDRELVIGPEPSSHIRADQLAEPVVLSVRDGRLFCNSKDVTTVNDRPMDRLAGIPMGAHVCVGPLSFAMTHA